MPQQTSPQVEVKEGEGGINRYLFAAIGVVLIGLIFWVHYLVANHRPY